MPRSSPPPWWSGPLSTRCGARRRGRTCVQKAEAHQGRPRALHHPACGLRRHRGGRPEDPQGSQGALHRHGFGERGRSAPIPSGHAAQERWLTSAYGDVAPSALVGVFPTVEEAGSRPAACAGATRDQGPVAAGRLHRACSPETCNLEPETLLNGSLVFIRYDSVHRVAPSTLFERLPVNWQSRHRRLSFLPAAPPYLLPLSAVLK